MSNYTKATNFATKDALTTGNPLKTLSGTELDDEFNAISVASATKSNANNAALTGVPVAPTASQGTSTTQVATTAFVAPTATLASDALPKAGGTMTGIIAGFESTGINDNATSTKVTVSNTGVDVTGTVTADGLVVDSTEIRLNGSASFYSFYDTAGTTRSGYIQNNAGSLALVGELEKEMTFWTNNSERMRIDSSGNVGIGTSSPAAKLESVSTSSGANIVLAQLRNNATAVSTSTSLRFVNSTEPTSTAGGSEISSIRNVSDGGALVLKTAADTTATLTERMRIDSSGNVLVGKATAGDFVTGIEMQPVGAVLSYRTSGVAGIFGRTNDGETVRFTNNSTTVGSIVTSGSSTSYNTSSDHRLKTDVQPMTGATATFMQLNPVNFEWIADGTRVDGFLAHELGEVIPAAATGTHNGMMDEEYQVTAATGDIYTAGSDAGFTEVSPEVVGGPAYYDINGVQIRAEIIAESAVHEAFGAVDEVIHSSDVEQPETLEEGQQWRETTPQVMATRSVPDYQGIDQAKVVPLLVATLQEVLARIAALEA